MSAAFVLGNGKSRLRVNLEKLSPLGTTYGCNWLYKDFTPDCLVATDRPIADHIQKTGYAQEHRFHTRKPIVDLGGKHLNNQYKGNQKKGGLAVGHHFCTRFEQGKYCSSYHNNDIKH